MSNQPPPPFGQQPPQGPDGFGQPGQQPPPPGSQPPGFGQPPGGGQPPGFGQAPGGGQPPGFGGGQPPGFGGGQPPGFGGPPGSGFGGGPGGFQPQEPKSKTPIIVAIAAVVALGGGGAAAYFLTQGGDEPVALATDGATEAPSTEATDDEPTAPPAPTRPDAPPTPPDAPPTAPAPPPTAPDAPDAPPTPPDAPPAAPPSGGESMTMNESAQGEITSTTPTVDFFFDGTAGAAVQIQMIALSEDLDPVLRLYGPDGVLVEENDDFDLATSRNSRITTTLPVDGQYRIEADSFASSTGPFEVTLTFPSVLTATDTLSDSVPEISYDYEGVVGTEIQIDMVASDDSADPLIRLIGPDGTEVASDDDGGEGLNARLSYTIDQAGTYTVVASAFAGNYGPYEITLTEF